METDGFTKSFKLIVIIGTIVVAGIVIYFSFFDQKAGGEDQVLNNVRNQLPEYILPTEEEERVKEFAFNFIKLYNNYSFSDYSNLLALGDYQTPLMQEKTLAFIKELETSVQKGFMQEAEVDQNYFVYEYPNGSTLNVKVKLKLKQYSNYYPKPELDFSKSFIPKLESTQNTEFKIELIKYGKNWLVNNIVSVK